MDSLGLEYLFFFPMKKILIYFSTFVLKSEAIKIS